MKKPRTFAKKDGVRAGDLLQCGEDHLSAAKALFSSSPAYFDSAGYLTHMGLELLMKSWLLKAAGEFPGIHRLSDLYDDLVRRHGAPSLTKAERNLLAKLDKFETLRYPNRKSPTEVGTADSQAAEGFVAKLRSLMPKSIRIPTSTRRRVIKSGRVLMKKRVGT